MTATNGRRTLVLFPGALGDFVCFLPTLHALARETPVDLFARSEFADLAPASVRVRSLECHEVHRLFVGDAFQDDTLGRFFAGYTSGYSWMGSGQDQFVRQFKRLAHGRAQVFPFHCQQPERHQSEYYLSCLGIVASDPAIPEIALQPQAQAWSADYWARHSLETRRVLVMAPGSGAREKNWPARSFAAVAQWWREQMGGDSLALLGPAEEERGGLEPLLRHSKSAPHLSLAQIAALVARADLYLGNDSGITHLAAALGVPTLALFGPSDAQKWRPRGARVRIVQRMVECAPCSVAVMKSCSHRNCLQALEPAAVIEPLEAMLRRDRLDKGGGRD